MSFARRVGLRTSEFISETRKNMNGEKLKQFRDQLLRMRERVGGEVNHVVQAIQEEVNINSNLSSAPVHLADVASGGVDADVEVLHTERSIWEQVSDALTRIDEGSFGECEHCGRPISEERLKALPYTPFCVECARSGAEPVGTR
jgi:RNA polymerase-binding protein DksA